MTSNKSDIKQVYEDLKEQFTKLSRTFKTLETRALKPNFSTDELASKSRKSSSFKAHKNGERGRSEDVDVKNVQDGQTKLERALETLQEIQKQKNSRDSKIQGAAVGKRRKTKRSIQFEKIENDIANYKSLIVDVLAAVEPVNQVKTFVKLSLQEGRIPRNKEEKTRQELATTISRWNALGEEVLNTTCSIEAFISEVQMEYSKLNLWLKNSDIADSWLMEYEAHADKPEKLGTTIRVVRLQLHENQTVLDNFRKAKPRLHNMYDTAVALMKSGRLDETDADELERVINVLVAKWESIDNRLNASRDRIYAEVNRLRKRMVKQRHSIIRRFSSRRNSSFRRNRSMRKKREIQQRKDMALRNLQSKQNSDSEVVTSSTSMDLNSSLEPVRVVMTANKEYQDEKLRLEKQRSAFETFVLSLKSCEKAIQDLDLEWHQKFSAVGLNRDELKKQLDDLTRFEESLKKSRAEFQSEVEKFEKAKVEGKFDDTDGKFLEKRVNNLQSRWEKLWGEHIANKHRLEKKKGTFETFDLSLKSCEKNIQDLDSESLQKFSAVESSGHELKKQMDDITRFESDLRKSRTEFQSVVERFEKAKREGLFNDKDRVILEKRVNDLQSRWDELWREHIANKNRIVKATLEHNHKSMQNITEDFDKIEKQINTPEKYDNERLTLEENILKQKRLMEDLDSYDEPINQVRDTTSNLLEKQLVDRQTFSAIQKKTGALSERQKQMKNACRENGDKFASELLLLNQRRNETPSAVEEETVRISDDYSMLSQSLDDILADEGFAELESSKSYLEMRMCDFDKEVQSMNQWMDDSEKLVHSLHVGMDPKEVTKKVQEIKKRCEDIEKQEAKMKHINKLGQEITNESLDMTTAEGVEVKLQALNTRWRDTKDMLSDYRDKDDEEAAAGYRSCCCFQMMTKAFHACFYS